MTTTTAGGLVNGTALATPPPPPAFPCESFRDAAPHLRRPFTPAAVKFKVQATWPSGGLIVAYIDARLAVERLNLIVPHLWHDTYRPIGAGQMWCDLTVDAITRSDIGEGKGKGLVSDALKRAAVKFGVGVSLYAIPSMMLNNSHLDRKKRGEKEAVTLTPQGLVVVQSAYSAWLEQHGIEAFGEPLSHGDVEGAQGDAEAEAGPPAGVDPDTGEVAADPPPAQSAEGAERIFKLAKALIADKVLSPEQVKMHLVAAGATDTASLGAAIDTLTVEAAAELEATLVALVPEPAGEPAGATA